jgi:Phage tail protein (Tail_P2_I)
MAEHLLPTNATELEIAFSLAADPTVRMDQPATDMRGIKLVGTPPAWLPFLVYEYGLGELTPYVPNLYELIDQGIDWQRVRGTQNAIDRGLAWVGYTATLEEASLRRARWHLFQLELDRVRDFEEPDLDRIEAITQLSVPVRSHFWRGYKVYDTRAIEYGWNKWSDNSYSTYSGARLRAGAAKWSFGRLYELDHTMTEGELTALGVWQEPVVTVREYTWAAIPWPSYPWREVSEQERRTEIIEDLCAMPVWFTFLDDQDEVIGHRKARACHPVSFAASGSPYQVAGNYLTPSATPSGLYVEAMTDFSDGYGSTAAKWQITFGATVVDPDTPGLLWAEPGEITGGVVATEKADTIEFGRTVRERCRALLRVI